MTLFTCRADPRSHKERAAGQARNDVASSHYRQVQTAISTFMHTSSLLPSSYIPLHHKRSDLKPNQTKPKHHLSYLNSLNSSLSNRSLSDSSRCNSDSSPAFCSSQLPAPRGQSPGPQNEDLQIDIECKTTHDVKAWGRSEARCKCSLLIPANMLPSHLDPY